VKADPRNVPLPHHRRIIREMEREQRAETAWPRQLQIAGLIFVAVLFVQASAWDEKDFALLSAEAAQARANAARYLVEHSGYQDVAYKATPFNCRAPLPDERLVMQLANPRDPGKGYRCTYWLAGLDRNRATVTWSRSPDVVRYVDLRKRP
jgi:hypothetical protein